GGSEAEVLLLVAAKRLDLIDVGNLEGERGQRADGRDRDDIVPFEAIARDHIGAIERRPDQHGERKLDEANGAGEHDRRIGGNGRLRGELQRGRRKRLRWQRDPRRLDGCHREFARVELEHDPQTQEQTQEQETRDRSRATAVADLIRIPKKFQENLRWIGGYDFLTNTP